MDVKGGIAGEGKDVILSKLNNQDSQKWTANWGKKNKVIIWFLGHKLL